MKSYEERERELQERERSEPKLPWLIGITGYKRSGKDTVARVLGVAGYERVGLADPVKEAALALDPYIPMGEAWANQEELVHVQLLSQTVRNRGWEGAKAIPEVRRILQRLGTEVGRGVLGEEVWIQLLWEKLMARTDQKRFVVPDVRFPNEAEAIRDWKGVIWKVVRPGHGGDNHPSERGIEEIEAETTFFNNGAIEDLEDAVGMALALEGTANYSVPGHPE